MKYRQYRDQRIQELLATGRWPMESPENTTKGLLDLIEETKPVSVLEIGSLRGVSTELFLLNSRQVYAIDPWESDFILGLFIENCGWYPHLVWKRGKSPDDLKDLPSNSYDLAYIDGDHSYEAVKKDLEVCKRICRRIAGHDYNIADVQRAVDEVGKVKLFSDTSWLITEMYDMPQPQVSHTKGRGMV